MKIIIVGLGRAGSYLVRVLSDDGYDVTVVDTDKSLVDAITDKYNVNGIVGSGASKETLLKAGADTADALVALTHIDEINLLSCMQAKSLGTRRTAARLLLPDFVHESDSLGREYNIDYFVKPKLDIAEEIYRNIGLPGFVKMEGFFGNEVQMINLSVLEYSPLNGKSLIEIKQSLELNMLVCTVIRDGKLHVPDGTFVIETGDQVGIVAAKSDIQDILDKLGIIVEPAKSVAIVGGGITGEYLTDMLVKDKKNLTILENNIDRCRQLMEKYPSVQVSYSEGDITEVLEEENIGKKDVLVSLTDNDETNLVISMFAWSQNVPSIITRVDKTGHVKLLHKVNMDITVSTTELSVLKMLRFIRYYEMGDAQNDIGKFYNIADGKAEVMDFVANESFSKLDVQFKEKQFKLKKDVLIAGIIRDGRLIIPSGNSKIVKGDKVIVAATKKAQIRKLEEILA